MELFYITPQNSRKPYNKEGKNYENDRKSEKNSFKL